MGSSWTGWMLAGAVALGACTGEAGPRDELPPIGGTTGTGGTDTDTIVPQIGKMRLNITPGLNYPVRLRETNTEDAPCELTPPQDYNDYVSIDCMLDINELDLYGNGLDWDLLIPANACDYVIYWHYQYEAWEIGVGPTEVEYIDLGGGLYQDVLNSINGRPYCPYDYTWINPNAPNCCLGNYTLTVTDPVNGTRQFDQQWTGTPSSCYGGAAFIDPEAVFGPDGFPVGKIVYLNKAAYSKSFHFDPLTGEFYSNVPLSNYYNQQDHDGTLPAGLTGEWAEPKYTFVCTDRALEVRAQIQLTVREYNTVDEFDADGTPDEQGIEKVTGLSLDDLDDWGTATPGSDLFIEFGQ